MYRDWRSELDSIPDSSHEAATVESFRRDPAFAAELFEFHS